MRGGQGRVRGEEGGAGTESVLKSWLRHLEFKLRAGVSQR